ncbi:hypothetical protein BX265_5389 [Streptomyces sp. TLI_235]|nr:hypothetical protein [Streptomyces sp. TLI_235]PBC70832.1 hypothetical protein BX265_5389 [Streptomyces sp. TLI_235]
MTDTPRDERTVRPDTPTAAPEQVRPARGRALRRRAAAVAPAALFVAAGGLGYAYRANFAALGAHRFVAPPTFRPLTTEQDGPNTVRVTSTTVTQSTGPLGAYRTGVSRGHGPITARYTDGSSVRVTALGVHRHVFAPERELREHLDAAARAGVRLDGVRSVDPGPRGGAMACGTVPESSGAGQCTWVDGSMLVTYTETGAAGGLTVEELAAHARQFRAAAEVPG